MLILVHVSDVRERTSDSAEISSSGFPKFDRNPNTGEPLGKTSRWLKATQTIVHDQNHASYILLPLVSSMSNHS